MNQAKKIRVAVLYGGRSGEHEVSLRSAANVIKNLDRSRFEAVPIGIDKQGRWFLGEDILQLSTKQQNPILELKQDKERMLFAPSLSISGQQPAATYLSSTFKNSGQLFDVIFPAIHGVYCEDGTLQGLLELADLPYVGCGVLASAVGMDKDISKRLVMNAGLRVPPYLVIKRGQWQNDPAAFYAKVNECLTYPVFVKPANTGSSVGVHKIKNFAGLAVAIEDAFHYDTKIVVEQGIDAREIEISVLESLDYGADPIVSVSGEVKPQNGHEFYSYTSKYLDEKGADLIIPAVLPEEIKLELIKTARIIFAALECEGMARVDLFLEKSTNHIYFNEVNTLPGFTEISMYPKLMEVSGVEYSSLLTHLIDLAIDRHARKAQLAREYLGE